jgi:glycosyltransferase involved in cell wall biosynthesis
LSPALKKLYGKQSPLAYWQATRKYDAVFYLSDGSIPLLGSKRNILHMQVPFHGVGGTNLKNQLKKHTIHAVVVNSHFTKSIIDREYGVSAQVIYPPVQLIPATNQKKKYILSVGRFEPSVNMKKQDVLIEAFRAFHGQKENSDWSLVLAGGSGGNTEWIKELKEKGADLPIIWAVDASYQELVSYYQSATLYWNAAGYQVDTELFPEKAEHFGITTIEAISAGCIPLVYPAGGQLEIIQDSQFHWQTINELVKKSAELIKKPQLPLVDITQYSQDNFKQQLKKILT